MQKMLEFVMCGYCSKDYNPNDATTEKSTQKILLAINSRSLSLQEIAALTKLSEEEILRAIKRLERCELTKEEKKENEIHYRPGFPIFSVEDQEKLLPLTRKLHDSLVETVENVFPEIRSEMKKIACIRNGHNFPDIEYITVGAYTFDYGGLECFKKKDLIVVTRKMPGGEYVFTGLETGLVNLRESWMWGHNNDYGEYMFSGHGRLPPEGSRRAFPDLSNLWEYNTEEKESIQRKMVHFGDILFSLSKKSMTLEELSSMLQRKRFDLLYDITFLEEIGYVGLGYEGEKLQVSLRRPVLIPEDFNIIRRIARKILSRFIEKSVRKNFSQLEAVYKCTSPSRNGIDIREAFNMIYHGVFETALDTLIKQGKIRGPPTQKDGGRYSVWVAKLPEKYPRF